MIHLGDITKLRGDEIPPVDCITGGSPCQDLSVAGKRAGLEGERSGLFMEQIRIVKEMRERDRRAGRAAWAVRPRFMVWENVPGAFSSNGGKDFQAVLTEIVKIVEPDAPDVPLPDKGKWPKAGCLYSDVGDWSVAWRVHDAQFWGVPQRRKRIALVADFGGLAAPEVLFVREGLSGYSEPGKAQRKGTADSSGGGSEKAISFQERAGKPGGGKGILIQPERTGALSTLNNQSVLATVYGIDQQGGKGGANFQENVCPPILSDSHGTPHAVAYGISAYESNAMKSGNPHSGVYEADTARTLDLNGGSPACNQGGVAIVQAYCLQGNGIDRSDTAGCNGRGWREDQSYTLNTIDRPAVYIPDVAHALSARHDGSPQPDKGNGANIVAVHQNASGEVRENDVAYTIGTNANASGRNTPLVYDTREPLCIEMTSTKNTIVEDGISPTLTARMGTGGNQVNALCMDVGFFSTEEEKSGALLARQYKDPPIVVEEERQTVGTLCAESYPGKLAHQDVQSGLYPLSASVVRRLTPLECERLQGYPDGWTDIGDWVDSKGKKHKAADSPRYKALGNSIALPFWFWLLRRISAQYERPATLGSLFDGIGGFPLCWERCNGKGTAIWASEIEEFPISVTKIRFPEDSKP